MRGLTKREQNWIIHSLKFLIWLVGATTGSLSSSTPRTAKASRCVPPPDHDDLVLLQIVSVKFMRKLIRSPYVQRHLGRRVSLLAQKSTTIHDETRGANNATLADLESTSTQLAIRSKASSQRSAEHPKSTRFCPNFSDQARTSDVTLDSDFREHIALAAIFRRPSMR